MDPVAQLQQISLELEEHAKRLAERAAQVGQMVSAESDPVRRQFLELFHELFREQVETGLDFQREVIVHVIAAFDAVALPDAEAGLEPEDGDRILAVLNDHRDLLTQGLASLPATTPPKDRANWEAKLAECASVIERVEELIFDDPDAPEAEAESEEQAN